MKYRGVAYYPEAWPPDRWDRDIALMRDAGINLVRMGEFAWSRLEPREGEFDLDWWRDICGRMQAADIRILACTPSAAPPAWLTTSYSEVLPKAVDGSRPSHGTRRHYCPSSSRYREYVARINTQIASAIRTNEAVIGWQIDNEIAPSPMCHCETCASGFRNWLKARYASLDILNTVWGNVFWSGDFSSWEQIQAPCSRVSWQLDYQRFHDDLFSGFIREQAQTLRRIEPDWTITTNLWAGLNPATNAALLFDELDVAAYDGYWDVYADREHYSSIWDFYRNVKSPRRSFWLAETGAWNPDRTVSNSLAALRPWAFEAFAKGSEAHIYFRWRQSRMGEENHPAILDWSGRPGRPYAQIQAVFRELESLAPLLRDLPLPRPEVAILFDYDTAVISRLSNRTAHYHTHLLATNIALNRMQVVADILPVRQGLDLTGYRLLILPRQEIVDPWLATAIIRFVEGGGVVLAQTRLAVRDRNGKYLTNVHPVRMTDLFGVEVLERCAVQSRHGRAGASDASVAVSPEGPLDGEWQDGAAIEHMEMLRVLSHSGTLARYASGDFSGTPAITEHRHGQGWALYQGCVLDNITSRHLLEHALRRAGIAMSPPTPAGVEIISRGKLRFYLNHNSEPVTVPIVYAGQIITGSAEAHAVHLDAFGVCIVDESKRPQNLAPT